MLRGLIVVMLAMAVAAAGGFALAESGVDLPGEGEETDEPFPTATDGGTASTVDGSGGGSGSETTATPTADGTTATPVEQPYALTIDSVEECGTTCRDVTVSLTNQGSEDATDVTVYTRVFAGNSTAESDEVWRGSEDVGTLSAGETTTSTKRVELSFEEAYAVDQADGWVTIQTTIETDDGTVTFTERRNVN